MSDSAQLFFSETGSTKQRIRFSVGKRKYIDIGKRYGKLIVLERRGYTKDGHTAFICKCDCGNEIIAAGTDLDKHHTTSCGCGKITVNRSGRHSGFNVALNEYRQGARVRNLSFDLTVEQVEVLFSGECFYCGRLPEINTKGYMRNGIDRLDSGIGYTTSNCVSCCTKCNYLKNNIPYQDFINLVSIISERARQHNLIGNSLA